MIKPNIIEKIKDIIGLLVIFVYLGIMIYVAVDIEPLLIKAIILISMGVPMLKYIINQ